MNTDLCPGCKQPIDTCYYGGDCLEVDAIYREQQREKLKDIDIDDLGTCMDCRGPCEKHENYCYICINGVEP